MVGLDYDLVSLFYADWESLHFGANYQGASYQTFFSEAMGVLGALILPYLGLPDHEQ